MSAAPQATFESTEVPRSAGLVLRDLLSLTKPRLSSLVLLTMAGGMGLGAGGLSVGQWVVALLATAGTVGAANAFNCYLERDSDRFMARTAVRPLPAGRLTPGQGLAFGFALMAVSVPALFVFVNPVTGALGLLALLSYVLAYTPLKARTHWAMIVGAVPGALPPLMGWTAARGHIELPGLVLFGILFFWQLPHFIAVALFRKEEYRAAGLTSLPLQKGDDVARAMAVVYLVGLLAVSVLPVVVGVAGPLYLGGALGLGGWFFATGVQGWLKKGDTAWARTLFKVSLVYLTGLFFVLGADRAL